MGKVYSISVSKETGMRKSNVSSAYLIDNYGINGDAHAGFIHRQVSFLAKESIEKMVSLGLDVKSGDFAENITTEGIDLCKLKVGDILEIGDLKFTISQIGKICHHKCAIFYQAGDCVMPREGVFAVVSGNGEIKVGDEIRYTPKQKISAAVITLSDKGSKGEREDITGAELVNFLKGRFDLSFVRKDMIPDETTVLESMLVDFCDLQRFDLVITNGSTGVSPRDIAPDVTIKVIEKRLPGYEEAMRMESFKKTPRALVSRAVCGFRKGTLIINLPGSPRGAIENIEVVADAIEHTIEKIQGSTVDCAV